MDNRMGAASAPNGGNGNANEPFSVAKRSLGPGRNASDSYDRRQCDRPFNRSSQNYEERDPVEQIRMRLPPSQITNSLFSRFDTRPITRPTGSRVSSMQQLHRQPVPSLQRSYSEPNAAGPRELQCLILNSQLASREPMFGPVRLPMGQFIGPIKCESRPYQQNPQGLTLLSNVVAPAENTLSSDVAYHSRIMPHSTSLGTNSRPTPINNQAHTMIRREITPTSIDNQAAHASIPRNFPPIRNVPIQTEIDLNSFRSLYVPEDDTVLSKFHCLSRTCMEVFSATSFDVDAGARGRNVPIILNQVGIRCCFCAKIPHRSRSPASTYYPTKLNWVYQNGINIINVHFMKNRCPHMPPKYRKLFDELQNGPMPRRGNGRRYWSKSMRDLGVVESDDETGLRFEDEYSRR